MTDPIADMLSRIRNAQMAGIREISLPFSKLKFELAKIFVKEGFVKNTTKTKKHFDEIVIQLKYNGKDPVIKNIKRISKPSRRVYASSKKLPIVLNGFGIAILSTSNGLMTNKEAAKNKVGGEVLCEIY